LESLIVGAGIDDALRRAETYVAAGADAVLVHSRKANFDEIEDFCKQFKQINQECRDIPLVVVPTKYYNTSVDTMVGAGVNNFIWANHNLRASITAMENVSRQIYEDQSLAGIEHSIATVDDIFDYQNDSQLRSDDTFYMGGKLVVDARQQQKQISKMVKADMIFDKMIEPEIMFTPISQSPHKINPTDVREIFNSMDITYHVGVPDSTLKDYFNPSDTVVANEGIAMSMAAGYAIETGKIPLVYLQNSGIGNVLNPLVSLNSVYKVPSIMMVGWRGDDQTDEVQHNTQGRLTPKILNIHNIPYIELDGSETHDELASKLEKIKSIAIRDKTTVCILVRPSTFSKNPTPNPTESIGTMNPDLVMDTLVKELCNTKIITSTGFNSRRFYNSMLKSKYGPKKNSVIFCPGSMGHALSIGIGASQQTEDRVVVVDGDGGFHMHSGSAASVGLAKNMTHVILDNAAHESVGQQKTCGTNICLETILSAYSYDSVVKVSNIDELQTAIASTRTGTHAIICPTSLSNTTFGRPPMKQSDITEYIASWRNNNHSPTE
jgi:phosphonopyruvate decarboxylase